MRAASRRFSQRSRWQQATVAEASGAVDDHDLRVARETQVLQAVVGQDDVAPLFGEQAGNGDTIVSDGDRREAPARDQSRLIADLLRRRRRSGEARLRPFGAVATQGNADLVTARPSVSGVLPVPPTVRLPMTMTGLPTAWERSMPAR